MKRLLNKLRHFCLVLSVKWLLFRGYLGKDLEPLKCPFCGSFNIKHCNHEIGGYNIPDGCITEYDAKCMNCEEIIGHWAYGSWDL